MKKILKNFSGQIKVNYNLDEKTKKTEIKFQMKGSF